MDTSHYTADFIAERKVELTTQRQTLTAELAPISRFDEGSGVYIAIQPDFDSGSPEDGVDSSQESQTFQEREGQIDSLSKSLREVELALEKIEEGTYGRCEATGDWISEDRLKAYPAARTCSDDQVVD